MARTVNALQILVWIRLIKVTFPLIETSSVFASFNRGMGHLPRWESPNHLEPHSRNALRIVDQRRGVQRCI